MLECECGRSVLLVEIDESNGFMNAVEHYECPVGHKGSVVFNGGEPDRVSCLNTNNSDCYKSEPGNGTMGYIADSEDSIE